MGIQFTADEAVAALKRTALPSLVVEGKDDMTVYRWVERELSVNGVDVFPVGGRSNVLKVFGRRQEFPSCKVVFLVDSDLDLFKRGAVRSSDVVWTKGYSIENDVLSSGTAETLLHSSERRQLESLLDEVCCWFAFEVSEYLNGRIPELLHHVNRVVPLGQTKLCQKFCAQRGFVAPPNTLQTRIRSQYRLLLRGKTLLGCYLRFLSSPARGHNKYSATNLLDLSTKFPSQATLLKRLIREVRRALQNQ